MPFGAIISKVTINGDSLLFEGDDLTKSTYFPDEEIKLSSKIKGSELREELLNNYSSFYKKGFGVLVLESAKGVSYTEIT